MASLTDVQLLSGGVYGFGLVDDGGGAARIWFTYATEDEAKAAHELTEALFNPLATHLRESKFSGGGRTKQTGMILRQMISPSCSQLWRRGLNTTGDKVFADQRFRGGLVNDRIDFTILKTSSANSASVNYVLTLHLAEMCRRQSIVAEAIADRSKTIAPRVPG